MGALENNEELNFFIFFQSMQPTSCTPFLNADVLFSTAGIGSTIAAC